MSTDDQVISVEVDEDDAEGLTSLSVDALFDDEEQDRIREAGRSRAESPAAFLRDAVLDRLADVLGEDGHLECWVDDCEETFTSERRRRGHVGRVHSDNMPEGDFWCGICGYGPTTYPGVGSHHGQRHTGEAVRPLDHDPDRDELLAPDDVPDHMDRELLERLYYECDGSYTEMCRRHDFGVTTGRVRHYLIEYGIHEVTPQGEGGDDHPVYRDRDWLKERYDAAGGIISEMHRNLEIDVPYRTLVKNVKRYDFHDPTDPPGRRHGKGGPKPDLRGGGIRTECPSCGHVWQYTGAKDPGETTACGTCQQGNVEIGNVDGQRDGSTTPSGDESEESDDDDSLEDLNTADDLPADERAFVLRTAGGNLPIRGTFHTDEECRALDRKDSFREIAALPRPLSKLEDDDNWDRCGLCPKEEIPAHRDPEKLRAAYDRHDTVAAAAREFPEVTEAAVYYNLVELGIHEPATPRDGIETECPACGHVWEYKGSKEPGEQTTCGLCDHGSVPIGGPDVEPPAESEADPEASDDGPDDEVDEPFWCGRCGYESDSAAGVRRHNGQVHDGESIVWDVQPADEDLVGDDRENPLDVEDEGAEDESTRHTIEWDFEPGFKTVIEQEELDSDRLVEEESCPRCGREWSDEGLCEDCTEQIEGDVATAGGFG